jgi:site-specific DNA-adenine methylase
MRYVRHEIAKLIPPHTPYVEPFAGHCWVAREVCRNGRECIVGDIDKKALNFCLNFHKINAEAKLQDWRKTVNEAPKESIFLFDPPWQVGRGKEPGVYASKDHYSEIVEFCKTHKCIINVSPQHEKDICNQFKCREYNITQGRKNFRYIIAHNLDSFKPI